MVNTTAVAVVVVVFISVLVVGTQILGPPRAAVVLTSIKVVSSRESLMANFNTVLQTLRPSRWLCRHLSVLDLVSYPMAELMLRSSPLSCSAASVAVAIDPECMLDPSPTAASYALALAVLWSATVGLRWFQPSRFCRRRTAVRIVQRPTVGR